MSTEDPNEQPQAPHEGADRGGNGASTLSASSAVGEVVSTTVAPDRIESPSTLPGSVELPPEDQVRRDLAYFALRMVAGVIAAGLLLTAATPWLGIDPERTQSTIQFFFTATITLAGSVFGFYFASKNR